MIGAGNVAWHLARQFKKAGHEIMQIVSRTESSAQFLANECQCEFTDDIENIRQDATLYVIAVSDDAVEEVAEQLYLLKGIVVHTSAMTAMETLEPASQKFGVFYPLQTMTKGIDLNFREIPIFIEASSEEVNEELKSLALSLSDQVLPAGLKQRQRLHVSAVLVNNFTNHLFHAASQLLKKENMTLDILMPLIRETIRKVESHSPFSVQTGPAKRGDMQIIEQHLEQLSDFADYREIYLVMTESLLNAYKKTEI